MDLVPHRTIKWLIIEGEMFVIWVWSKGSQGSMENLSRLQLKVWAKKQERIAHQLQSSRPMIYDVNSSINKCTWSKAVIQSVSWQVFQMRDYIKRSVTVLLSDIASESDVLLQNRYSTSFPGWIKSCTKIEIMKGTSVKQEVQPHIH